MVDLPVNSALMLACAQLRHVAGPQWGNKKYMNMKHLWASVEDDSTLLADFPHVRACKLNLQKILDTTLHGFDNHLLKFRFVSFVWYSFGHNKSPPLVFQYTMTNGMQFKNKVIHLALHFF